jgi:prepilin-type N-terminal cleavage/methylation domain-containing protein
MKSAVGKGVRGFSLVELVVALVLAGIISLVLYRVVAKTQVRATQKIRDVKVQTEVAKAIDRLYTNAQNAVAIYGAKKTILGSTPPDACSTDRVFLPVPGQASVGIVGHGVVPLPGLTAAEIDPLTDPSTGEAEFTVLRPDTAAPGTSDGIRLAFLPADSAVMRVTASTSGDSIPVDRVRALRPGDFAIISNSNSRELFRVTSITGNSIVHDPDVSFWNRSFPPDRTFGATAQQGGAALVQKVEIATVAHDPVKRILLLDTHQGDDGFNAETGLFTKPGKRIPDWAPLASSVATFTVHYEVWEDTSGKKSEETRMPRATKGTNPKVSPCLNQVGYPLFRHIRFDVAVLEPDPDQPGKTTVANVARRAGPRTIQRPVTAPPEYFDGERVEFLAPAGGPTPPPGGPTPTPAPLNDGSGGN